MDTFKLEGQEITPSISGKQFDLTEYETNLRFFKDDIKMNRDNGARYQDFNTLETQRRFLGDEVTEGDMIDA